ncbi:MAG: TrpB-like pyridoxal phosphate-dependent enzyme [Bacteroidetes bacterium]|jgi:tryptophan synthase beta chain|nr:TrpB-like pyridoxal phosphate-dependent enzyme [Bacteroidota bacterium]
MEKQRKFILDETKMPRSWYNIMADMKTPPQPPLHPGTKQPLGPDDLAPLFPQALIAQEMVQDRFVEIPDDVRRVYKSYRPSPLYRARELEKALDSPAKIYYKYEGGSPSGSHKPNTAIPQAFYNQQEGVKRITTETGAGQWGSALSFACKQFGIDLEVFMVRVSYDQKPYRKLMMQTYGAAVHASPSRVTEAGQGYLDADPNHPGSLGIAISEAIEMAMRDEQTKYSLGSVLNHVLLHQTIMGQEAIAQFELADDMPDVVIAPFGGGSNFAGLSFPFIRQKMSGERDIRCIAVEPSSCPKLTQGEFKYDFGDSVGLTPLLPMYTLGHDFVPAQIHAGGLRYHGAGVLVSQLLKDGIIEAEAKHQLECFEAGLLFARTEGIIPAPEANYGIAKAIEVAKEAQAAGQAQTILLNLCGHGHFDLSAYDMYLSGQLKDHAYQKAS